MPSRSSSQWQSTTRKQSLGKLRRAHPASGATWNVQVVRGKMTSKCLWHACRALVLGMVLMLLGAGMATVGYYANHISSGHEVRGNATIRIRNESRGLHLNNLSYVGPIIMGFGGFIVVAACVMTFEARDSAAKVVPARFKATGSNKSNVRSNNGSATSNRRANGQKSSRWDHHAGLFRTSPAEHPPPPPIDRQALTAALIHFSKTIGNSPRLSPQQRRFSRSGSVPNLTSSPLFRTHLSPHRKRLLFDQNLISHRHLHHHHPHHQTHSRRLSKSRSSRISGGSLAYRESSNSLLHPTLLQLHRHALSVDESGPYYGGSRAITDSPRDSLKSVIIDSHEGRLRDRTKRSDTAKRHILARQKPVEKEEPNSPRGTDERRRSSATSDASYASRQNFYRRTSSSRTPSIDSRSVQVELHSPEIEKISPRTPRRFNSVQSSTPSFERELRSQLSICSEPITTIRQLSGQSSLNPCVLEESPDSEERELSMEIEQSMDNIGTSFTTTTVNTTIKNLNNLEINNDLQQPSVHCKRPRPDNLQLLLNFDSKQSILKCNKNENENKNKNTKLLKRSSSSRTFYRPKSKPLNDYDQIYFINSSRTINHNQDDLYDSLRVINERRRTILKETESINKSAEIETNDSTKISETQVNNFENLNTEIKNTDTEINKIYTSNDGALCMQSSNCSNSCRSSNIALIDNMKKLNNDNNDINDEKDCNESVIITENSINDKNESIIDDRITEPPKNETKITIENDQNTESV